MKSKNYLQKPIIFIGNPRTGTSVISEIILRHKELAFPSQYQDRFPTIGGVNLIRQLFDNKLWRFFGQKKQLNKVSPINRLVFIPWEAYRMWEAITPADLDFGRRFLRHEKADDQSKRKIRRYFSRMVRYQGKNRLAFKITGPARMEYLLSLFPDAIFIRIHRNPLATIRSLLKVAFWKSLGKDRLWWQDVYTPEDKLWAKNHEQDSVALTAFQIHKVNQVTEQEIMETGAKVFDIQYKEFIENPSEIITRILDFCSLSHDDACYDYLKENKIYNRNTNQDSFFSESQLKTISEILGSNH